VTVAVADDVPFRIAGIAPGSTVTVIPDPS
jgi:hypothetical protein